jgi:hypothetical protein
VLIEKKRILYNINNERIYLCKCKGIKPGVWGQSPQLAVDPAGLRC